MLIKYIQENVFTSKRTFLQRVSWHYIKHLDFIAAYLIYL